MTPSLRRKLEALAERREELERLLADPGVAADNARFRDLSREFAQLEPVATALAAEARAKADLAAAEAMRGDPELGELAEEEVTMFHLVNHLTNEANNPALRSHPNQRRELERAGGIMLADHTARCDLCHSRLN